MDLLKGITGGGVTWTLEFEGGRTEFRPGEIVRGTAVVAAERDLDARRLMAALVGEERYEYTETERSRDGTRSASRWGSEELARLELQLAGPTRLGAGQALRFPFAFPLAADAPPSFESSILTARWEVRAWADTGGRDPSTEVKIRVHAAVPGSEPRTGPSEPTPLAAFGTTGPVTSAPPPPDPADRAAIDSLLGASGPAFGVEGLAGGSPDTATAPPEAAVEPVAPEPPPVAAPPALVPAAPALTAAAPTGGAIDPRWQVEPRPLVAGEPFRALFRPAEPLDGSTRVELKLEVATTESGGLPISLILAEGFSISSTGRRGKQETIVLWRGSLSEQPQPDGSRAYAIAGDVPAGSTPTVVLPHGWARAFLDIVVDRRLRRDEHFTVDVPIVTTR